MNKRRKLSDDDGLASEFVFGDRAQQQPPPEAAPPLPAPEPSPRQKTSPIVERMQVPEKEATVRLTVDLPRSMHQKLSLLAAQTGRKKAEIVRTLLAETLAEMDE